MQRFVHNENIALYRKLVAESEVRISTQTDKGTIPKDALISLNLFQAPTPVACFRQCSHFELEWNFHFKSGTGRGK